MDSAKKGLLILSIVALFFYSFRQFNLDTSVTMLLLVGVWIFDAFMKYTYKFRNETLFADFSFGALVFSLGYWINLLRDGKLLAGGDIDTLTRLIMVTFILVFIWVGNLFLCQGLIEIDSQIGVRSNSARQQNAARQRLVTWVFSAIFAILSLVGAIYPQVQKLI